MFKELSINVLGFWVMCYHSSECWGVMAFIQRQFLVIIYYIQPKKNKKPSTNVAT